MSVLASTIINKAAKLLTDQNNIKWPRSELLGYLNDGQRQIILIAPNSSNATTVVQLIPGSRQTIPIDGWVLLDVYRNMGITGTAPGRAIRITSKEAMDSFNPGWHYDSATSVAKSYMYDIQDQTAFWVYPPNTGTGYIQLNYAKVPTDLTSETQSISVNDILQTTILDYILFRAFSKEVGDPAALQVAQGYWSSFSAALGAKEKAESDNSPNLSLTPSRNTTQPGAES